MITSIEIQNFKNLEALKIENLGRVNLFTGKNNTGKTSLLEAISIIANGGTLYSILEVIRRRNSPIIIKNLRNELRSLRDIEFEQYLDSDNSDRALLLKDLFNQTNSFKTPIKIESNIKSNKISFLISIVPTILSEEQREENGRIISKKVRKEVEINDSLFQNDTLTINELVDSVKIENNSKKILISIQDFFENVSQYFRYERETETTQIFFINNIGDKKQDNGLLWDKIILTPKYKEVISALQIIDPKIEELVFTGSGNQRIPKVKLKNLEQQVSLSTMGDGINKILNIILSLVNCKDGYLLIDEFENGLHYTVQEKLWEIIFRISKDLNVQVFATTHSKDSIEAFSKVQNSQNEHEVGKFLRLEKQKNGIVGIEYSSEDLQNVFEYHFELR